VVHFFEGLLYSIKTPFANNFNILDKFQMYDYGTPQENMKHYNQTTPPQYDLTQVKVPTALYSGANDWLADPTDVDVLRKLLPNLVEDYTVANYNHMDLVWGVNTRQMLYDRMLDLMAKY